MEMAEAQSPNILTIQGPFSTEPRGPERGEIRLKCTEFIRCSETCVGKNADAGRPQPPSENVPELRPVSLPDEIVLQILEYLNEPYKLRGRVTYPKQRYQAIVFYKPRLWANIASFQICHATRSRAIKRYGRPSPSTLPFDASVDIISLRADVFNVDDFDEEPPRPNSIRNGIGASTLSFYPSRFFYCVDELRVTSLDLARQCNYGFLDKISRVEIDAAGEAHDFTYVDWGILIRRLADLESLRTLRLKLHRHDACGGFDDSEWRAWAFPEAGGDPDVHPYNNKDLEVVLTLTSGLDRLKSLGVFEIEKAKAKCQAPEAPPNQMEYETKGVLYGESTLERWYIFLVGIWEANGFGRIYR